jgi:CubicO group peptidase (beta-lactamase class C family)
MPLRTLVTGALLALCALPARAVCPARTEWPVPDWADDTASIAAARKDEIAALEAYAFTLTGDDDDREGIRTDGVVIVKGGKVVYERYARGFAATQRHPTWSVTKSVTNALTGVAVRAGGFDPGASICRSLALADRDKCRITAQHLLEMSSGLDWRESYEHASYQASSVLAMLYGVGRRDMAGFVAGHPFRDEPGATYAYSTGDSTLLSAAVHGHMRRAFPEDWPWGLLFDRIGAPQVTLERDTAGNPVGGSYWYASPRDMARLGYLYLNDGCWAGERLLPEGWVGDATRVSLPYRLAALGTDPDEVYGRQFWVNRAVPEHGRTQLPWPGAPDDAYAARGHWGQSITVVPSLDAVIVRTADDREPGVLSFDRFLALALALVK